MLALHVSDLVIWHWASLAQKQGGQTVWQIEETDSLGLST